MLLRSKKLLKDLQLYTFAYARPYFFNKCLSTSSNLYSTFEKTNASNPFLLSLNYSNYFQRKLKRQLSTHCSDFHHQCKSSFTRSNGAEVVPVIKKSRKFSTMAPIDPSSKPLDIVNKCIAEHKVFIFSKSYCPFCHKVKQLFNDLKIGFETIELDLIKNGSEIQEALAEKTGQKSVPNVFINEQHVGGSDKVVELHQNEALIPLLNVKKHSYDYDYVVIGGGSGGLSSAKEAARFGAKVAVCDFVKPTPKGVTWGLGGTCVNVGCIPKKLMHQAAILGHELKDSREYGWNIPETPEHNWSTMVEGIQAHIGSLNWGYKVTLRSKNVDYLNAYSSFVDAHTILTVDKKGKEKVLTSDKFLVAVGGRPRYPDFPGAKEYCITSDDLFSLPHSPGKTLLIGASYISLECAGFLKGLGYDVTVMVRSILLRGFDRQMAERVGQTMERMGVNFIRETVPTRIEQIEEGTPGKLRVIAHAVSGEEIVGEYNTVVIAIGRDPCTKEIGLDNIGVQLAKSNKIIVDRSEVSSLANIYAVGDVIEGGLELTPVAIQAGQLLARRLFGNSKELMDYGHVPTTVFTPIEYSTVGTSEEVAIATYGENNVEVYHSDMWPLEYTVAHRPENDCYVKLITQKKDGNEYVVGIHYLGPNAGEVMQGFAIALKLKATKSDFDNLVGIHPTCAEMFTTLSITKRSGMDSATQGC